MLTFSLQSGSNGNCIYVEAGDVRLLFDAGISGRTAEARMAAHGRDIRGCNALILSHEHTDHVSCAGIFHRKFGLPVYCTRPTFRQSCVVLGKMRNVRFFTSGRTLEFGDVHVRTFRTPHDAVDTVCFVVEHDGAKLGILTDLGSPFRDLADVLGQVDAAFLESNYDPEMLWSGTYPELLKRRIAGSGGHLSNQEAAMIARDNAKRSLKWIAAAHLSEENNDPQLAVEAHRAWVGKSLPVHVASRYGVSEVLEI